MSMPENASPPKITSTLYQDSFLDFRNSGRWNDEPDEDEEVRQARLKELRSKLQTEVVDVEDWKALARKHKADRHAANSEFVSEYEGIEFPKVPRMYGYAALEMHREDFLSDDWRVRKYALEDYIDVMSTLVEVEAKDGDKSSQENFFRMLEQQMTPLLSDENSWVRHTAAYGFAKIANVTKSDGDVRDILVAELAATFSSFGRLTSSKAILSLKLAQEDPDNDKLVEAMLIALKDEHWLIRQTAKDALLKFAKQKDSVVLDAIVELLADESIASRKLAVSVITEYVEREAIHDSLSDQRIAQKIHGSCQERTDAKAIFEALDENGNNRLSTREFRIGFRQIFGIELSIRRLKQFLGKFADKDITFEQFLAFINARIQRGMESNAVTPEQSMNPEQTASDMMDDIVALVPIPINPTEWILEKLIEAHGRESSDVVRHDIFSAFVHLAPISHRNLPTMLANNLKASRGRFFVAAFKAVMDLTEYLSISGPGKAKGKLTTVIIERGKLPILEEEQWDLTLILSEALGGHLKSADEDVILSVLEAVRLFWDKGATLAALRQRLDETHALAEAERASFLHCLDVKQDQHPRHRTSKPKAKTKALKSATLAGYDADLLTEEQLVKLKFAQDLEKKVKEIEAEIVSSHKADTTIVNVLKELRGHKSIPIRSIAGDLLLEHK